MTGFALLVGHLTGDYLLQNDWIAKNKTSSTPICLLHVALYTLASFACVELTHVAHGEPMWPAWAWALIAAPHFVIDRWRLATAFMNRAGQLDFASGVFSPWSIIVVDNSFHLLTSWAVAIAVVVMS